MSTAVQNPPAETQVIRPELRASAFALLLGTFIALCFAQVLLGVKTFVYRDFGLFGYPFAYHVGESFWAGELPLWNPYNNCGLPFLAQWNTLVLYPLSLIYVLLPLPWSLNLFCLFHLFLGGAGMCALARRWTGSAFGAAIAGTAFVFNGLALGALMWPAFIAALGWMPWVVLTAADSWRAGGRALAKAALAGAMQMLAGAPEVTLFTWLFVAAFCFVDVAQAGAPLRRFAPAAARIVRRFAALVLLVAGLAAAQLLPFLELLSESQRTGEYSGTRWSMPIWGWANFLVPLFRTLEASSGVHFQLDQAWTSSYYAGIGVLALALAAGIWVRDARARVLVISLVLSLVLALGDAGLLYPLARKLLLLTSMRYPVKFVVCAIFAISLLAAFGVAWCESGDRRRRLVAIGALLLGMIGFILGIGYFRPIEDEHWPTTLWSGITRAVFLAAILGGVLWQVKLRVATRKLGLAATVVAMVWLDGFTHAPSQNPIVDPSVFSPELLNVEPITPKPRLGEARAMLSLDTLAAFTTNRLPSQVDNFVLMRLWQYENLNLLERIPKVDGFYSLYLTRERDIHFHMYGTDGLPRPNLGDFLGVSQVTKSAGNKAFSWSFRETHLPLMTLSANPVFLDPLPTLTNLLLRAFNPRQTVFLPAEARAAIAATNGVKGRILTQSVSANHITAEVETPQPNLLVVAQMDYPAWKAYIDGKPAPIHRANYGFQAIEVPAGRHKCELRYEDNKFRAGLALSALSFVVCAGLWLRRRVG